MSNWFISTFKTVREKSIDTLEFVRKDLTDFSTIVKTDTENYLHKLKNQSVGDLHINRIVSRLSNVVTSDNDNGRHIVATASFDRLKNERTRLQKDESTYLIDPTPIEIYETWREKTEFNVDNRKGEIAQLLIDAPHVRSMYARLVPVCTTHSDFWSRYYFRLHQLDEEEIRRVNLLKRAHEICNEHNGNDWDEPDDEWSKDASNVNQQSLPISTTNSENIICERKESDTGDSWEKEFDETELPTSKTNAMPLDQLHKTVPTENVILPVITTKKSDNEFDDEWESWS